ncbi:MAG: glucose-1-phosphate thymidylyltransferase [Promethearchaeota archaeon]|nr:MAG: glucose-1-phosphate thymidylyltransferase [Candidatus Lokiarchaeota archaeon]
MKAVILAAGEGKRLRPITSTRPKPMIPVGGKPLLEHTILSLKSAGIKKILLIVGYKEEYIRNYFGNGSRYNLMIDYITQDQFLGTAHATGFAKDFVEQDSFLLLYGDILVDDSLFIEMIKAFKQRQVEGLISLIQVQNPNEYGIISLDSNQHVFKITEKPSPEEDLGNLANAGIYIFTSQIFQAIDKTQKSVRNEYEFTDSMQILITDLKGKIFGYDIQKIFWSDIGLPWQLLDANKHLLDKLQVKTNGTIEDNVKINGIVSIGKNTVVKSGTYIQGPVSIGENCKIGPNAYIRPYCSIGNFCHIGMSEIKNSIIFSYSAIPHFNYVGDSIICEHVNLGAGTKTSNLRFDDKSVKMNIKGKCIDSKRRKLGCIIGPYSQTGINASIMCGKIIYENSIIGAQTLINNDIPPNTLAYQNQEGNVVYKSNRFTFRE